MKKVSVLNEIFRNFLFITILLLGGGTSGGHAWIFFQGFNFS